MSANRYKSRYALIKDLERSGAFDDDAIKSLESMNTEDACEWIGKNVELKGWTLDDVRSIWTKPSIERKKVTIEVSADAGEEVEVMSPQAEDPEQTEEMDEDEYESPPKSRQRARSMTTKGGRLARAAEPAVHSFNTPSSALGRQIKAYDSIVKSGRSYCVPGRAPAPPAFSSGEKAFLYGAAVRNRLIELYPGELGKYRNNSEDRYLSKALGTTTNELGGALVPNEFIPDLLDYPNEYGAFSRAVGTTPMPGDTATMSRVTERFIVGDIGEGSQIEEQNNPQFDNVTLVAAKKGGIVRVNRELIGGSAINLAEVISRDVKRGFDKYADDSGLLGLNGYRGMNAEAFTASGVDHYDAALSTPLWSEYDVADISTWLSLIPSSAWGAGGVAIVCHRAFFGSVFLRFAASAATVSDSGRGLFNGDVSSPSGADATFWNYPVYFSDSMPSSPSSDQISAIAGSFPGASKYGEVTGSDEIMSSEHRYFEYDQIGFRALRRLAINNHNVGGSDSTRPSLVIGLKD